jgi:chloramphenicol-sensitive protein RarD
MEAATPINPQSESRFNPDVIFGILAYVLWGLIPLYFKTVAEVASAEVLAHRVLWSFVVLVLITGLLGRWREAVVTLHHGKTMFLLGLGSFLIACNWLTFIHAVSSKQVLQSSLGYFLGPLINVLLGTVIFRERLRWMQMLSVAIAAVGVLVLALKVGQMPWIAIILALTGAFHALTRKLVATDSLMSLTLETLVALPIALGYLFFLVKAHDVSGNTFSLFFLLMLAGPVTTVPFLCFGRAVQHLPLTTMGILLYLMPSIQFFLAVLVFHEPFSTSQLAAFICIWVAIAIYATDSYRTTRRNHSHFNSLEMDPLCETD